MYLLELNQNDRHHIVGLFLEKSDAINWIESVENVRKDIFNVENNEFVTYEVDYADLPEYTEVVWHNSRYPLTKYMFVPDEGPIEFVIWDELPIMNNVKGYVDGTTQVDAYLIPNAQVKDYIQARNEIKEAVSKHYESLGKKVHIGGIGSEDGEYLSVEGGPFVHLDAITVKAWREKTTVEQFIHDIENN